MEMEVEKIAVFPGSFDPVTKGHERIVRRALPLFDRIVVSIGSNAEKQGMFPIDTRKQFIEELFRDEPKVSVDTFSTLTVEYCRCIGAKYLLRGLRTAPDFEYERVIALTNKQLAPDLETIFLLTDNDQSFVNASVVRDLLRFGQDLSDFVPESVSRMIRAYLTSKA